MPKPTDKESLKEFTTKFMGDKVMNKDYPDQKQRYAIMLSVWKKAHKEAKAEGDPEYVNVGKAGKVKLVKAENVDME